MQYALRHSDDPLKVWEKIEIVVGEGSEAGHYSARIEDFNDSGIVITPPEFDHGSALLKDGSGCTVVLMRDDAVYQYNTQIRMQKTARVKFYVIGPPKNVKRVQRRQFVRIEMLQKIRYAIVDSADNDSSESDELSWNDGTIVNLSGGGVLLKNDNGIKQGTLVVLNMSFLTEYDLPDMIVAVCKRSFKDNGTHMSGFEFLRNNQLKRACNSAQLKRLPESVRAFDNLAQNEMINFVFRRQIELHQKGLL